LQKHAAVARKFIMTANRDLVAVEVMKAKEIPERHDVVGLWLDDKWMEKGVEMIHCETLKTRVKRVRKWLEEILVNPQYCSVCGALKYDFVLMHDGREYTFALWKITDKSKRSKNKVIAESDYKKLGPYFAKVGRDSP
jgi:hypothetical protein